jgi:hypothetical protein
MVSMTSEDRATKTVSGLRELADWLEQHPEYAKDISFERAYVFTYDREEFVTASKALGGMRSKSADTAFFNVERDFGTFTLQVTIDRGLVCEKKVTTTEVVESVPDPALVANIPLVEVTKTVETVEWECEPSVLALVGEPA